MSVSYVFALVDDKKKHHQRKLQRVKTILVTSRSWMQQSIGACTRAETLIRTCPCATYIWLLHPAPTSSQDAHLIRLTLPLDIHFVLIAQFSLPQSLMVFSV